MFVKKNMFAYSLNIFHSSILSTTKGVTFQKLLLKAKLFIFKINEIYVLRIKIIKFWLLFRNLSHIDIIILHIITIAVSSIFKNEPFTSHKFISASTFDPPKSSICQFSKRYPLSIKDKITKIDYFLDGNL